MNEHDHDIVVYRIYGERINNDTQDAEYFIQSFRRKAPLPLNGRKATADLLCDSMRNACERAVDTTVEPADRHWVKWVAISYPGSDQYVEFGPVDPRLSPFTEDSVTYILMTNSQNFD